MPYDKNFYEMYAKYLKEKNVRANHDFVFRQFKKMTEEFLFVVDLGCGLGEYHQYGLPFSYVGFDVNNLGGDFLLVQTDYHDFDMLKAGLHLRMIPNVFVSLFSIECFHSADDKYALYRRIFETFPSIRFGLVGGFFYENKRGQEKVIEEGHIVSYQTIEDPSLYISDRFTEFRFHIHTPSKMFGPDVVEVWKIFIRC
jgi:hypothetical protein